MIEDDSGHLRRRYRLVGLGLIFGGIASGVMVVDSIAWLAVWIGLFDQRVHALFNFLAGPVWQWGAGSSVVFAALIGSMFLLGRWDEPLWRRRSGFLFLTAAGGLFFWTLHHARDLGIAENPIPEDWARDAVRMTLRWFWMGSLAMLATMVAEHLGREDAQEAGSLVMGLVVTCGLLYTLYVLQQTGWPFQRRGVFTPLTRLLAIGVSALRAIASFLLTLLCLNAARRSGSLLRDLRRSTTDIDSLRSRSEAGYDALLSSADGPATSRKRGRPMKPIVIYDGDCALCHQSVNFVLNHDPGGSVPVRLQRLARRPTAPGVAWDRPRRRPVGLPRGRPRHLGSIRRRPPDRPQARQPLAIARRLRDRPEVPPRRRLQARRPDPLQSLRQGRRLPDADARGTLADAGRGRGRRARVGNAGLVKWPSEK